jgi:hypothetical protein
MPDSYAMPRLSRPTNLVVGGAAQGADTAEADESAGPVEDQALPVDDSLEDRILLVTPTIAEPAGTSPTAGGVPTAAPGGTQATDTRTAAALTRQSAVFGYQTIRGVREEVSVMEEPPVDILRSYHLWFTHHTDARAITDISQLQSDMLV